MQDGVISLFVLFSQFRLRDVLRGLICLLYNYACIYMWVHARAKDDIERNSSLGYHHLV